MWWVRSLHGIRQGRVQAYLQPRHWLQGQIGCKNADDVVVAFAVVEILTWYARISHRLSHRLIQLPLHVPFQNCVVKCNEMQLM